jgi:hypothetical protein
MIPRQWGWWEKRGPQNEGKSHDVVENTCMKNVSSESCHDVDENKRVMEFCHDVLERKEVSI